MDIQVCVGSACHLKGSYEIISKLQEYLKNHCLEEKVVIKAAFCLGHCTDAVSVKAGDKIYSLEPDKVNDFLKGLLEKERIEHENY
jgi:NADH:ubiquinone oxidoreductase subunit E